MSRGRYIDHENLDHVHLDDEVLNALLDGELADGEAQAAFAHQAVCGSCRARMEAFRRVSILVGWADPTSADAISGEAVGSRFEGSGDDFERILEAAFAGTGPGERPVRRRALRTVASVAAGLVAVAIFLSIFGQPPVPTPSSTGLTASLGTFSSSRVLGGTLATEIASLAPNGSAPLLPCQEKAAGRAGEPPATTPAFSAPLVYAGVKAEVFAYISAPKQGKGVSADGSSGGGSLTGSAQADLTVPQVRNTGSAPSAKFAVVVRDGDCTLLARLTW
jgi:anti-sigma factor RsiW